VLRLVYASVRSRSWSGRDVLLTYQNEPHSARRPVRIKPNNTLKLPSIPFREHRDADTTGQSSTTIYQPPSNTTPTQLSPTTTCHVYPCTEEAQSCKIPISTPTPNHQRFQHSTTNWASTSPFTVASTALFVLGALLANAAGPLFMLESLV